jgi:uncharacterized protein
MTAEIIINTGPLITLARIDAIGVISHLPFRFISPQEVFEELKEGESLGYPKVSPEWLVIKSLTVPVTPATLTALDLGESAVIQMALERQTKWVCIDEWKARRAALSVGLHVVGVLGLLARAKKNGIIAEVSPYAKRAVEQGIRYHPDLIRRVLVAVDESW